jgi:hypothetical protein
MDGVSIMDDWGSGNAEANQSRQQPGGHIMMHYDEKKSCKIPEIYIMSSYASL